MNFIFVFAYFIITVLIYSKKYVDFYELVYYPSLFTPNSYTSVVISG
jgi:hypothetical protein